MAPRIRRRACTATRWCRAGVKGGDAATASSWRNEVGAVAAGLVHVDEPGTIHSQAQRVSGGLGFFAARRDLVVVDDDQSPIADSQPMNAAESE